MSIISAAGIFLDPRANFETQKGQRCERCVAFPQHRFNHHSVHGLYGIVFNVVTTQNTLVSNVRISSEEQHIFKKVSYLDLTISCSENDNTATRHMLRNVSCRTPLTDADFHYLFTLLVHFTFQRSVCQCIKHPGLLWS